MVVKKTNLSNMVKRNPTAIQFSFFTVPFTQNKYFEVRLNHTSSIILLYIQMYIEYIRIFVVTIYTVRCSV